jgi:hypothetical protein
MNIEQLIATLIAALNANTEALNKAGGAAPAAGAEKTTKAKPAAVKDEPKITQDMVNAALVKIKDDFGMPEAKVIIKDVGKVDKMSDIKPATFQAVYDAAVARHAELTAGDSTDPGDGGL